MTSTLDQLRFTMPEILSLIGLVQCVYILVYMGFRAGGFKNALVPFLYFLILGLAFLCGFAARLADGNRFIHDTIDWALWSSGPPFSVLLMIQIVRVMEPPSLRSWAVLALIPLAFMTAAFLALIVNKCRILADCSSFSDWLTLSGFAAGLISLFDMWSHRPVLKNLAQQPAGRDRYWLICSLVIADLFFLGTMLFSLTPFLSVEQAAVIRTIWGLGFVYLAGTSLFRIYPQAVHLVEKGKRAPSSVSDSDHKIAQRIENLLTVDKIYQEPAYNRVNLAKELGISESIVSRVINQHFGKSLPQIFNERRVADACRLLQETDAPMKTIADDVGFNSMATFNRVFKEIEGVSPGQFREDSKRERSLASRA